jgi:hypothetical protein
LKQYGTPSLLRAVRKVVLCPREGFDFPFLGLGWRFRDKSGRLLTEDQWFPALLLSVS